MTLLTHIHVSHAGQHMQYFNCTNLVRPCFTHACTTEAKNRLDPRITTVCYIPYIIRYQIHVAWLSLWKVQQWVWRLQHLLKAWQIIFAWTQLLHVGILLPTCTSRWPSAKCGFHILRSRDRWHTHHPNSTTCKLIPRLACNNSCTEISVHFRRVVKYTTCRALATMCTYSTCMNVLTIHIMLNGV